jgi:hypothetical protein
MVSMVCHVDVFGFPLVEFLPCFFGGIFRSTVVVFCSYSTVSLTLTTDNSNTTMNTDPSTFPQHSSLSACGNVAKKAGSMEIKCF